MSRIFVETAHAVPLAQAQLWLPLGAASDPLEQEGLCRFAAELCRRGAGPRDRAALDAELDRLGASLDVITGTDCVGFVAHGLSRHLPRLVELLADVLVRPLLADDEASALVTESLASLDELRDDDASLCARHFERAVFPGHAYGRSSLGTEDSLEAMNAGAARAWWQRQVARGHALVGFSGDVKEVEAVRLADGLLAALPDRTPPVDHTPEVPRASSGRRTVLVDKPERTQAQILVGQPAPRRAHADWLPLSVAAAIFGGTFTSRLMSEVRVKRGWSYGASARVGRGRHGAAFRMRLFPSLELTPQALELVLGLYAQLVDQGVTPEELKFAVGYLSGSFAFELATPADRLGRKLDAAILGLPDDVTTRYLTELAALTPEQVNQALRRHLDADNLTIVLTGTEEALAEPLTRAGLAPEIAPFDEDPEGQA